MDLCSFFVACLVYKLHNGKRLFLFNGSSIPSTDACMGLIHLDPGWRSIWCHNSYFAAELSLLIAGCVHISLEVSSFILSMSWYHRSFSEYVLKLTWLTPSILHNFSCPVLVS